ncbi:dephospho-CoA kinase [Candidatus Nitrosacidococcus tergens]|uniref:Dephospho-CoA kinase n=1 Tax=Candidatus Nitrosacidococcus tergens TaxID=553981 RepID=A0A7G1Q7D7_9GAMM|nr:dephospho-CoA kinase [Candidatus Nitrosacidococcus tergens]CAB1274299.1 dephospho-CoA kinase [Candidatus Nitrosacidococcus tergens]
MILIIFIYLSLSLVDKAIYKIGLTGGIGSGKSTVAQIFSNLGVPIIDADIIARELVAPNQPALAEIVQIFSSEVLDSKGVLNRQYLHQKIFSNKQAKKELEAILHPRIIKEIYHQARQYMRIKPYCILVIPLLLEIGLEKSVDRILVVDVPESLQFERVKKRDEFPNEKIKSILYTQCSQALRLSAADDCLINNQDLITLAEQINCYHQYYLSLAKA